MSDSALPFRLLACDMDGTLLNDEGSLTEYTKRVLFRLTVSKRVNLVFATGRHHTAVGKGPSEVQNYFRDEHNKMAASTQTSTDGAEGVPNASDLHRPGFFLITSNGARIHDPSGKLIFAQDIDPVAVREMYAAYADTHGAKKVPRLTTPRDASEAPPRLPTKGDGDGIAGGNKSDDKEGDGTGDAEMIAITLSAYTNDEWIKNSDNRSPELWMARFGTVPRVVDHVSLMPTSGVGKLSFRCEDNKVLLVLEKEIAQRWGDRVSVTFSSAACLDVMDKSVCKAAAVEKVAQMISSTLDASEPAITLKQVIAFGDSMNDKEMLECAGKGCIMVNGQERLKTELPQCEVIGDNNDDGVAKKLAEVFAIQ